MLANIQRSLFYVRWLACMDSTMEPVEKWSSHWRHRAGQKKCPAWKNGQEKKLPRGFDSSTVVKKMPILDFSPSPRPGGCLVDVNILLTFDP